MYNNGKITAPVNTDDVSAVLGVNSHDVATLCKASSIRKFNKNKPYRGTNPSVASRTVDDGSDANNGTGKYLGHRGATTGLPVYWGMQYPMSTRYQRNSSLDTNTLFEICYYVATRAVGINFPNYAYQKPVNGTDFSRLDDFVGYNHNYTTFFRAGVAGAKPGNFSVATLDNNSFQDEKITVYALMDNPDFSFGDIIPDSDKYYLVAEFYKLDDWKDSSLTQNPLPSPFLTKRSTTSLINAVSGMITFDVSLTDIRTAGKFATNSNMNFIICVGFNKLNSTTSKFEYNCAFVAPWAGDGLCATKVNTSVVSPYVITFLKYANITSGSSYNNFPTTNTNINFESMRFQATVKNNSSTTMHIYGTGTPSTSGLMFRVRAYGSYGDYASYNGGHLEDGGSNTMGAARVMKVGTNTDVSANVNNVAISAGNTMTLYFQADTLIPYGTTTNLSIEVSNDGGQFWAQTGLLNCNFRRVP